MIELVKQKQPELAALCRAFQVARLDLFGSAATGKFNPETSDLDFVIEFENRSTPGLLDRYLDFAEALEKLFNRHVDLVTRHSIRNPYFRKAIAATREPLYEHRTPPHIAVGAGCSPAGLPVRSSLTAWQANQFRILALPLGSSHV